MKYDPEMHPHLAAKYAKEGLINTQIAQKLNIGKTTLYNWQKRYVEFRESLKKNKEIVDYQVESALLKKALGYEYEEIEEVILATKTTTETKDGETSIITKQPVRIKRTRKIVHPDTTACIFWLKNRDKKKWRSNPEQESDNGDGTLSDLIESLRTARSSSNQSFEN
ncbi:MAG: hypothetical protein ACD_20C00228G0014 [uncultured bacterium]|nr:MAG: hypothetical protein ACD_20C00228G0014 [uncultured bacterium]